MKEGYGVTPDGNHNSCKEDVNIDECHQTGRKENENRNS